MAWHIEAADYGPRCGLYASLSLDRVGRLHISYYNGANRDLVHASVAAHRAYLSVTRDTKR